MSRRATGMAFLAIAAFLFATRYIAAALYSPPIGPWDEQQFAHYLGYVGDLPWQLAGVALLAGIGYLLWAERSAWRARHPPGRSEQPPVMIEKPSKE